MLILNSANIATFDAKCVAELYAVFKRDFLDTTLCIESGCVSYDIDVNKNVTCLCPFFGDEKVERFWHLITTDIGANRRNRVNPCSAPKEKRRKYDPARAKRIHWIKPVIKQWLSHPSIKHFYQKRGTKVNLILWLTDKNFAVIIRKLNDRHSRFLVSSYLVYETEVYRYKKQLKAYEKSKPMGIEWF